MAKRILVVDDDLAVLELLRRSLGSAGFEVITARDGAAGLLLADAHRPDLLIVDLAMPRLHGFDTIRRLRERPVTERIPIIVLSAHVPDHMPRQWMGTVQLCLTKPFAADALAAAVQRILSIGPAEAAG